MGGRGSGGGGGSGGGVKVGKSVTAHHATHGEVKGTVSKVNKNGSFHMKNARSSKTGKSVSGSAVFKLGNIVKSATQAVQKNF